jgi:hypothetical protein
LRQKQVRAARERRGLDGPRRHMVYPRKRGERTSVRSTSTARTFHLSPPIESTTS